MLIKSVELKNIKSYRHDTIQFHEGINGISGENGHGKTTILEAIGYVLFDSLPYKEADFLRRGEKSGYAAVEVLVNGASYTLTRKLGAAAEYSMRGDTEIEGKKDVLAWLIHNAFPGLNHEELPRIFENAVGVPQGMFTAAFIEPPAKRKKTFDEILKVEEYRNAYENLRSTMALIDEGVREIENGIDKTRIRTENYGRRNEEKKDLFNNIENINKALGETNESLSAARNARDARKKQKEAMDKLENEIKQRKIKIEGLRQLLEKTGDDLKKSQEAQKVVSGLSTSKEKYEAEKKILERLEGMRKERDSLKDKLNTLQSELALLNEKNSRLESLKKEADKYAGEKAELGLLVEKQEELEKKLDGIKGENAVALNEIKDIKSRMSMAGAENACPVMKGIRCVSVKDFSSYFRQQLAEAQGRLAAADSALEALEPQLKTLGDPRSKMNAQDMLSRKLMDDIGKISKEIEKIPEKERATDGIKKDLDKYSSLDTDFGEARRNLGELEPLYRKYLQNQPLASRFMEFKEECERLENTIAGEETVQKESQEKYMETCAGFDAESFEREERACAELGEKVRGLEVELREKGGQLRKIEREIADMEKYLAKIAELESELENEKQFGNFAKFIRETLRDSAQHIVLELIGEISEEANNLYCAIMDDFSQELRWGEDYGIIVKESGEEKNFHQLSGGEKMGAALALRLALLKMLSNSDFVFLDEPTANMDEIRRENLSEQIMNIKGFKQIFVISHDDTFNEKYGHVVKIEKLNGESRVVA